MMRKSMIALGGFFVLVAGFGSVVFSSENKNYEFEFKKYKGIRYVSGGVGKGEREALQRLANDYSLRLAFAISCGHYFYKVDVSIKDTAGRIVLESLTDGPWLFADLPAGEYTVKARSSGRTVVKKVLVSGKGQPMVTLFWGK